MKATHGEYRRHERTDIRVPVAVGYEDGSLQTDTLNVSTGGIGLRKPTKITLKRGQVVQVQFTPSDSIRVPATVVHVGEHHVGLKLYKAQLSDLDIEYIIDSAPAWQRLLVYFKRNLWTLTRRVAVFSANTFLRPLILAWVKPTFLFAVYGTRKDVSTYYTPTMEKLMPPMIIGGMIRNRERRGLLVASKFLESELSEDSEKVRQFLGKLRDDFQQAEKIALVGRLPNFTMKAGIPIESPFVDGSMGTRYMIWDVARQMRELNQYKLEPAIVVLGGAGRIGSSVCEDLLRVFARVVAFDNRYQAEQELVTEQGTILLTANPRRLSENKLFIGLTHHGDVIRDLIPHIPRNSLIADDTHPCISLDVREELAEKDIRTLKIVLSHEEFSMWPRMPAWNNRDLPGCLVEALVLLEHEDTTAKDFDAFRETATQIGFRGRLIEPLDE